MSLRGGPEGGGKLDEDRAKLSKPKTKALAAHHCEEQSADLKYTDLLTKFGRLYSV